jgi:hypothetical protein
VYLVLFFLESKEQQPRIIVIVLNTKHVSYPYEEVATTTPIRGRIPVLLHVQKEVVVFVSTVSSTTTTTDVDYDDDDDHINHSSNSNVGVIVRGDTVHVQQPF